MKEQTEFEISRLETEVAELSPLRERAERQDNELSELKKENELLKSDVENQKSIIEQLRAENADLAKKNADMSKDYVLFREKARQYDEDKRASGGILERAKAESDRMLAQTKKKSEELLTLSRRKAEEEAAAIKAESEKTVEENIRKVRYLYKRRDELLSAFEKVKDAAGGFYDSVIGTLSEDKNK